MRGTHRPFTDGERVSLSRVYRVAVRAFYFRLNGQRGKVYHTPPERASRPPQKSTAPEAATVRPWRPCAAPPVYPASRPPEAGNRPRRVPLPACQRFDRAAGFATIERRAGFARQSRADSGDRGDRAPRPASGLSAIPANIGTPPPSEAGNRSTVPEVSAPVSGQAVTPEASGLSAIPANVSERRAAC